MPRNMSFSLTTEQFKAGTKTVTRRLGWKFLKPGDFVWGVEKAMGLKPGESIKRLGMIRIVDVRRERLLDITEADVRREGFPHMTPFEFIHMFCQHMGVDPTEAVTRIEFEHLSSLETKKAFRAFPLTVRRREMAKEAELLKSDYANLRDL